jgi:hypothetical protein
MVGMNFRDFPAMQSPRLSFNNGLTFTQQEVSLHGRETLAITPAEYHTFCRLRHYELDDLAEIHYLAVHAYQQGSASDRSIFTPGIIVYRNVLQAVEKCLREMPS